MLNRQQSQEPGQPLCLQNLLLTDTLSFSGGAIFLQPKPNTSACFRTFQRNHTKGVMLLEPVENPQNGAAVEVSQADASFPRRETSRSYSAMESSRPVSIHSVHLFRSQEVSLSKRGELEFTAAVQRSIDQGASIAGLPMQTPRLHLTRSRGYSNCRTSPR